MNNNYFWTSLDQVVLLQVKLQNGIFHSGKYETNVFRVCGTRKMRVDNLIRIWVQINKHLKDKLTRSLSITLWT